MTDVSLDSPSAQSYLAILQGVISRMAANSANAKTWCVGLVSAILIIVADKRAPGYVWVALVPSALLFFLDAYYLGLERLFRDLYNNFIRKLHAGKATVQDVFIVTPGSTRTILWSAAKAMGSISIWPFYLLIVAMLFLVKVWIL